MRRGLRGRRSPRLQAGDAVLEGGLQRFGRARIHLQAFQPSDLQDLVDQAQQLLAAAADDLGVFLVLRRAQRAVELGGEDLGEPQDRIERGAQFVADQAQEGALLVLQGGRRPRAEASARSTRRGLVAAGDIGRAARLRLPRPPVWAPPLTISFQPAAHPAWGAHLAGERTTAEATAPLSSPATFGIRMAQGLTLTRPPSRHGAEPQRCGAGRRHGRALAPGLGAGRGDLGCDHGLARPAGAGPRPAGAARQRRWRRARRGGAVARPDADPGRGGAAILIWGVAGAAACSPDRRDGRAAGRLVPGRRPRRRPSAGPELLALGAATGVGAAAIAALGAALIALPGRPTPSHPGSACWRSAPTSPGLAAGLIGFQGKVRGDGGAHPGVRTGPPWTSSTISRTCSLALEPQRPHRPGRSALAAAWPDAPDAAGAAAPGPPGRAGRARGRSQAALRLGLRRRARRISASCRAARAEGWLDAESAADVARPR